MANDVEKLSINSIRTLSMDAVQKADSGHPGTPMAMAPVVYTLWQNTLRFDPEDPIWPNRDRFVLSIGHASMLIYSILHLTGVKAVNTSYETVGKLSVTMEDISNFRQMDSRCPGHPEYRWTSGIETTTGPLGQGVANSVGMAIAGKWLAATYNKPEFEMYNYNVYAICGDGCMMEGVSSEAASIAGHLKLDNLCWIYDNNKITIEGSTALAFTEDIATRFKGYGWNVMHVSDANDVAKLNAAIETFKSTKGQPTFIIVDSHIGYGSPNKQDKHSAHGEPLGEKEIELTKQAYGWTYPKFTVPDEVYTHFKNGIGARGKKLSSEWKALYEKYKAAHPDLADALVKMQKRELPEGWEKALTHFPADAKGIASRDSSGKVLNELAKVVPWLIGGSADLAPSTKTRLTFEGAGDFLPNEYSGRNFHFGVREHAMGSILNGMSLTKVRPYGSGFLIFSDYSRASIRLSAIMEIPVIHIFTHDSIGVGEDGPTHQPVEHLISLRAIPGLIVMRPGDANEVVEAWRFIMKQKHEPVCLILSRQALPTLDRKKYADPAGTAKGGYTLACNAGGDKPDVILIGTGSEVQLVVGAYEKLVAEGVKARVVSMPSCELFDHQSAEYRESVLPSSVTARVVVEQASTIGWERYVGSGGKIIGMHTFGASAPLKHLQAKFGFTPEAIYNTAKELAGKK
jgi:transketolase